MTLSSATSRARVIDVALQHVSNSRTVEMSDLMGSAAAAAVGPVCTKIQQAVAEMGDRLATPPQ